MGLVEIAKRSSPTDWIIAVFTIVLACAAIYQFIIMGGQLDEMRRDQRPWLYVEISPKVGPNPSTGTLTFPVSIVNGGKTPALHVVGAFFSEIVHQYGRPTFSKGSAPSIINAGTIFPGLPSTATISRVRWKYEDKRSGKVELDPLSPDDIGAIDHGTAYVVTYGPITYDDIFGISHETKWCTYIDVQGTVTDEVASCAEYNNIDQK